MINVLFIIIFLIAIIYAIITGKVSELTSTLLKLPYEAIIMILKMGAVMILFSGMLEIAKRSGFLDKITCFVSKMLKPLFPHLDDKEALDYISLNLTCNFLGINGAATSAGIKAMEKLTHDKIKYNEITTFLTLNASGFCLIPQSIVAIRQTYIEGAYDIILPTFLVSLCCFISTIILNKVMIRYD